MLMDGPNILIYVVVGACLLGWLFFRVGARFGNTVGATPRDPRDDRIRSLEANQRVAKSQVDKTQANLHVQSAALKELQEMVRARDTIIGDQQNRIGQLQEDLKSSVIKTPELRTDLTERAAENLKSEAKLRDVETELAVSQASHDLIATGVLDYNTAPDEE
jgi:chromosome segregation ATPase